MALRRDRRGVSEAAGVGVLIGLTVLIVALLGVGVLLTAGDEGQHLEFQYEYQDELNQLTIIYQDDDELAAGDVYVDGPANNVTWAELAEIDPDQSITEINTVFVQNVGAYGTIVHDDDYFRIVHSPEGESADVIGEWNAGEQEPVADDPLDDDPLDDDPRD